jgi:hypothetical protein
MGWPFEPADVAARITGGDPGSTGERLAQVFFEFLGATPIPCRVDGDPARRGNP